MTRRALVFRVMSCLAALGRSQPGWAGEARPAVRVSPAVGRAPLPVRVTVQAPIGAWVDVVAVGEDGPVRVSGFRQDFRVTWVDWRAIEEAGELEVRLAVDGRLAASARLTVLARF